MTIERVLIALDLASCTEIVARRGGEIARQLGARPLLLHVAPPPSDALDAPLPIDDGSTARELTLEEYLRGSAERRLVRLAALVGDLDAPAEVLVRFGRAAEVIVDEARRSGANLIVVGTHGRKGIARAVRGSVSDEVVRNASVPVMIVRSHLRDGCAEEAQLARDPGQ